LLADADLDDPRFIDPSHTDVFEDPVVNLALPSLLDDNLLLAIDQSPERRGLRLLSRVRTERKVYAGVFVR
jgi:hypothetical protein